MENKIDYISTLTLEEVVAMEKAVKDITSLIKHQNLVLMNLMKHHPPALSQLINNILILNCSMNDHLAAISQWLGDSLFNMLKSEDTDGKHC